MSTHPITNTGKNPLVLILHDGTRVEIAPGETVQFLAFDHTTGCIVRNVTPSDAPNE